MSNIYSFHSKNRKPETGKYFVNGGVTMMQKVKFCIATFLIMMLFAFPGVSHAGNIEAKLPAGSAFQVISGTQVHMHVGSDGKVGIGTTNPDAKFKVSGGKMDALYGLGEMTAADMDNVNNDFGRFGIAQNNGGDLYLRGYYGVIIDKNGSGDGEGPTYNNGANPAAGTFAVRTRTSDTTFRTDLAVRYNGNVGIGTTSPAEKLDVSGVTKTMGLRLAVSTVNDTDYNALSTDDVIIVTATTVARNVNLPVSNDGRIYRIINTAASSQAVFVNATDPNTLDTAVVIAGGGGMSATVVLSNNVWYRLH